MKLREKAEEIFAWGVEKREKAFLSQHNSDSKKAISAWSNHSRGVAKVAQVIAEHCGLDADRAFSSGLLHDIGRSYGGHTGLNHITDGYKIAKEKGMPEEIAGCCLTHSFYLKEKVEAVHLDDEADEKFLKKYILEAEYDDYDYLIQLADFMAGSQGVTTIERRFCSVFRRHEVPEPRMVLCGLYELKQYFDQKAGTDVYELFRGEIEESIFNGIPGEVIAPIEKNIKLKEEG